MFAKRRDLGPRGLRSGDSFRWRFSSFGHAANMGRVCRISAATNGGLMCRSHRSCRHDNCLGFQKPFANVPCDRYESRHPAKKEIETGLGETRSYCNGA